MMISTRMSIQTRNVCAELKTQNSKHWAAQCSVSAAVITPEIIRLTQQRNGLPHYAQTDMYTHTYMYTDQYQSNHQTQQKPLQPTNGE
jgi:hypothetical protein